MFELEQELLVRIYQDIPTTSIETFSYVLEILFSDPKEKELF